MRALEGLLQDLRFAARTLRKTPAFSLLAIGTLALGIGANTAIFSLINGVLLKPLPYRDGGELVLLQQRAPGAGRDSIAFSIGEVRDYRDQLQAVDGVVEYHSMSFTLLNRGEPDRVLTGVVSHEFFDVLGVRMHLGRTFTPADDVLDSEAVLILSHPYWLQKFGGDPDIVGQVFEMNDRPHTVVGVLPPIPQFPRANDVYMPTVACPFRAAGERVADENRGAFRALRVFGRLADGSPLTTARADVATVASRFTAEHPETYTENLGFAAGAEPLFDQLTQNARPMLLILLGTTGLVLLIACANVANLMLSRTLGRERELAVRAALGAPQHRLLRQIITESTLLSVIGGTVGVLIATQGLGLLTTFTERFTPRTQQIDIDGWVLLFALGVSVVTGVVFGAMPALSSRRDLVGSLKEGGAQSTEGGAKQRLRSGLIVAQVAVSFMLLIGAGLLLASFMRLTSVDPGFDPENVLAAEVFPNWSKYTDNESRIALFDGILDRLESTPGVTRAAVANTYPLIGQQGPGVRFEIEGVTYENPDLRPQLDPQVVSPGYFETIGVPVLLGRPFNALDDAQAPPVAMISQSLAERHWPGQNPDGHRIRLDGSEDWITIVGVAADVRQYGLDQAPNEALYRPVSQIGFAGRVLVRTSADPMTVAATVRDAVHAIDPEQPIENFVTLEEVRSASVATPRLTATLLTLFAALALLITVAGITGVIATSVSQRTQEFGLRMALGAQPARVLNMVLRQGVMLVLVGLGVGLIGAIAFGRVLSGFLFATQTTDPATFVAVGGLFVAAAVVACLVPARRATAVDPMIALRRD